MDGLAATQTVSRETPAAKIVVLTAHNQPDSLLRVLRSGARGCVLKTAPTADLVRAIETVNAGSTFFSNELSQHAVRQMIRGGGEGPHASDLSNREREILITIAEGLSNKEIASRLNIAVRTVETHRERLIKKLNIHTTAGLTRFAVKTGLITVPVEEQMQQ
jgi:two-component system nitrate/nitrite response regulator NarL